MFIIAVCDDEVAICSQLEKMILDDAEKFSTELEVETYSSGEELFQSLLQKQRPFDGEEGQPIDLLFLDIELKTLDGIRVGHKIREELKDETIQIVYISSKQGYAMQLFDNRPMNFLLKPLIKEKIDQIVEKAIRLSDKGRCVFEFQNGKKHFRMQVSQIMYFESNKRKIRLVTKDQEYEFYGRLAEIQSKLGNEFIKIHQSHIINMKYIAAFNYETVILTTKETFSISQPYRAMVRAALLNQKEGEFRESF